MSFSLMNGGFYGFLCFCICFAYLTFTKESKTEKVFCVYPNFATLLKNELFLVVNGYVLTLICVHFVNSSLVNRFQIIMVSL